MRLDGKNSVQSKADKYNILTLDKIIPPELTYNHRFPTRLPITMQRERLAIYCSVCYSVNGMQHTLHVVGDPPEALKKARLDNIALVPASLLPLKSTYKTIANNLPRGSVLCVPATHRQRTIVESVRQYFKEHGRTVITLPLERITRTMPKPAKTQPENLQCAF